MRTYAILLLSAIVWAGAACAHNSKNSNNTDSDRSVKTVTRAKQPAPDTLKNFKTEEDFIPTPAADKNRYDRLSDADFEIVAKQLGVEVAAIKAVVQIEAGKAMKGFFAPGVPVINFDPSMYRVYGPKAKNRKGDKSAKVPPGLTGYGLKEWTLLTNARHKNRDGADMGTFWGMFQIGGFNYKLCGCKDVQEMVARMSESEFAQLELFAKFLINTGMLEDLRKKNWAGFARKYNGASYARRGYHTKMAAAYRKFKGSK